MTRKTGTREWSTHSANCCLGCRHACLYCYARLAALRWKKITDPEDWKNERADALTACARQSHHHGVVMFPTAHDITAGNGGACMATLSNLVAAGNNVLVVSKAAVHVPLMMDAARRLHGAGTLELRVSLTCLDVEVAAFWEPGAPTPGDRLDAIRLAAKCGICTSIAAEPLLEPDRAALIVKIASDAGAAGEIWIGAANHIRERTAWCRGKPGLAARLARLEAQQTPDAMRRVYDTLHTNPQVRWKDSYQKALGIDAFGNSIQEA
jgi:DNA repair photolyase